MRKFFTAPSIFSILFFCFFWCSQLIQSQEHRSAFTEKYRSSMQAAKLFSNELIVSKESNVKAFGLSAKAFILSREGNYEEAKQLFIQSFEELDRMVDKSLAKQEKIHCLNYYSDYLIATHQITQATQYIQEGLQLSQELDEFLLQIRFKNLTGRSFSLLGLGDKAIENGVETIKLIQSLEGKMKKSVFEDKLFYVYLNTANRTFNFFNQDTLKHRSYIDSTKHYLQATHDFVKRRGFELSLEKQMFLYNLSGDLVYYSKNYNQAIIEYSKSLDIVTKKGLKKRIYQLQFRLAECYFFIGNYIESKKVFDLISEGDLRQYKLLKNDVILNYYYAQIFLKLGDPEKAIAYTEIFNRELEDYYQKMSTLKVNTFTQNELQEKKVILDELLHEKKENDSLGNYLKVTLVIIVILIVFLIFYHRYQKRKFKKKIDHVSNYVTSIQEKKTVVSSKITEEKAEKILEILIALEKEELFISQEYSLHVLAKKIGSNSNYVSQVINNHFDKSFIQHTNELRINYILIKLKEDKMYQKFTLQGLAECTGYKSLRSFNKHFKEITGISPKQYLDHLQERTDIDASSTVTP